MIRVIDFKTEYLGGKAVDWVHYCAGPDMQSTTNWCRVSDITPREGRTDEQVEWRWRTVGPAYEAWKQGNEVPETGTPLAAWPGLTAEQQAAVKAAGLRTVEEVAEMNDSVIGRIRLPNARFLKDAAALFLGSRDAEAAAAEIARQAAELAALREQVTALTEAPKRGRPRKIEDDAA